VVRALAPSAETAQQQQTQQQHDDDAGGDGIEARIKAAYEAGLREGYVRGAKITVDVQLRDGDGDSSGKGTKSGSGGGKPKDNLLRSVLKGLLWRLFSTAVTVAVAVALLGDALEPSTILKFGGAEFAAKLVMYVAFERLWLLL
jgi:uncharacterized membrane protein